MLNIDYRFRNNDSIFYNRRFFDPNAHLTTAVSNSEIGSAVQMIRRSSAQVINEQCRFGNGPLTLSAAKGWDHIDYWAMYPKMKRCGLSFLFHRCLVKATLCALHVLNRFGLIRGIQQKDILLALLERGDLDVNARDQRTGMTALHYACLRGDPPEYIQRLLIKGADPTLKDWCGNTAMDLTFLNYASVQEIIALATDVEISWEKPYDLMNNESPLKRRILKSYQPPLHGWGLLKYRTATLPTEMERSRNIASIRRMLA